MRTVVMLFVVLFLISLNVSFGQESGVEGSFQIVYELRQNQAMYKVLSHSVQPSFGWNEIMFRTLRVVGGLDMEWGFGPTRNYGAWFVAGNAIYGDSQDNLTFFCEVGFGGSSIIIRPLNKIGIRLTIHRFIYSQGVTNLQNDARREFFLGLGYAW